MMLEKLEIKDWLGLNAKLQQKKNKLRKLLNEKGILKRDSVNQFDHYSYFSEAQYKKLFTELFSQVGLELKFTELEYTPFEGSEKQSNGRMPRLRFDLFDIDTGFYESTEITGEGIDKGDKAGYKAFTGSLKYYLANTFLVATGDDPEQDSPAEKMNTVTERKASPKQIELVKKLVPDLTAMLAYFQIDRVEDLTMVQASEIIKKKGGNNGSNQS